MTPPPIRPTVAEIDPRSEPSAAIPCRVGADGLPIGLPIAGPSGTDRHRREASRSAGLEQPMTVTETDRPQRPRRLEPDPSATDRVAETLRREIVSNRLRPGLPLVESQLVERLGVSRTPIREALKLLAAEGLVDLRRNRAAIVSPLDPVGLAHLFEVEEALESFAAGLAAVRISPLDVERLDRLQIQMETAEAAGDRDRYIRLNHRIHLLIIAASGNPSLAKTHERVLGGLQRARNVALATEGRVEESILEHREILEALRRGDRDAACRTMARHIARTGAIVAEVCRPDRPSPREPASPRGVIRRRRP
jgi:DNA-binding GntR family transcriptional regulator